MRARLFSSGAGVATFTALWEPYIAQCSVWLSWYEPGEIGHGFLATDSHRCLSHLWFVPSPNAVLFSSQPHILNKPHFLMLLSCLPTVVVVNLPSHLVLNVWPHLQPLENLPLEMSSFS
jgi:hypothetical protein